MNWESQMSSRRPGVALVVFTGESDIWWLRVLRPGFRHCFAVIGDHGRWIIYDPLCHRTEITVLEDIPLWRIVAWYCRLGYLVVPWTMRHTPRRCPPWRLYTCVEAVKRALGIDAPMAITPWNLWMFLKNI